MNNDDFNEEKQNKFKEELKTQFEPYEQIINEDKEFIHEAFEKLSDLGKNTAGMDSSFNSKILARNYTIDKLKGRRDQLRGGEKSRDEIEKPLHKEYKELEDKITQENERWKEKWQWKSQTKIDDHNKLIVDMDKKMNETGIKIRILLEVLPKFDEHIAIYDLAIKFKESGLKDGGKRKRKTLKKKFKKSKKNKNKRKSRKY